MKAASGDDEGTVMGASSCRRVGVGMDARGGLAGVAIDMVVVSVAVDWYIVSSRSGWVHVLRDGACPESGSLGLYKNPTGVMFDR